MPAAAAASGSETFSGTIVFAAVPGTNARTVISSVVVATGGVPRRRPVRRGRADRSRLARNPDGSCSFTPLHEVDKFAESGTLSF
jgi:hypothetical protein